MVSVLERAIEQDIKWHSENLSNVSYEFSSGFLAGLRQALFLMRRIEEENAKSNRKMDWLVDDSRSSEQKDISIEAARSVRTCNNCRTKWTAEVDVCPECPALEKK